MKNTCKNCAWYCHTDRQCYGLMVKIHGEPMKVSKNWTCSKWAFDGLEDFERKDCEKSALMAMELA